MSMMPWKRRWSCSGARATKARLYPTDLTEGMGITKPSLYGVFGNKEGLFLKALERYERTKMNFFHEALNEPKARDVAEKILRGFADSQTAENRSERLSWDQWCSRLQRGSRRNPEVSDRKPPARRA